MPDRSKQHPKQPKMPPLPPSTPIDTAALGAQVQSLYENYMDTRGLLAAQNAGLRGLFGTQRGSIFQQRRQDIAANEGSMIERGLAGGTSQITSEADIKGGAASQLAAARNSMLQGLIANRGQAIQARRNYEGGLLNIQLAAGAQNDVQNILDQLLNNTLPGGDNGGGGGGNNGGGNGGGGGNGNGGGGNGGNGGGGGGNDGGGGDGNHPKPAYGALQHFTSGAVPWLAIGSAHRAFIKDHIIDYALNNPGVFGAHDSQDLIERFGLGNPPTDAGWARWKLINFLRSKYAGPAHKPPV